MMDPHLPLSYPKRLSIGNLSMGDLSIGALGDLSGDLYNRKSIKPQRHKEHKGVPAGLLVSLS